MGLRVTVAELEGIRLECLRSNVVLMLVGGKLFLCAIACQSAPCSVAVCRALSRSRVGWARGCMWKVCCV